MRVLNLYCGIGGNSRYWSNEWDITAIDNNEDVCFQYKSNNPNHEVIQTDAHEYLKNNFRDFDLIWTSPPCPTHSRLAKGTRHEKREFPDMRLYEEILFLKHFFEGKYVVENVIPFYEPLINPDIKLGRHLFWTNLNPSDLPKITPFRASNGKTMYHAAGTAKGREEMLNWLDMPPMIKNIYIKPSNDPGKVIRNCVHPKIGLALVKELMN